MTSKIDYVFGQKTLAELGRGHLIFSGIFSGFWGSITLVCVCVLVFVCMCLCVYVSVCVCADCRVLEGANCWAVLFGAAAQCRAGRPTGNCSKIHRDENTKNISQQQRNLIWKIFRKVGSHSNMTSLWAIVADQWLEQEKFQEVRQPWMEKSFETKFKKWLSKWPARLWERTATQASLEMIGWVG